METETTETPGSEAPVTESNTSSDTFDTILSGIKDGDRQKYKTVEDALGSIPHAQSRIKELEDQTEEMAKKLAESQSVETLLAKLEEKATKDTNPDTNQSFDESKLDELIESRLVAKEHQTKATNNLQTVIDSFKTKFGDKASEVYDQTAANTGMTIDQLKSLSETSPEAVLRIAGISGSTKSDNGIPPRTENSIRSEALGGNQTLPSARVAVVGATSDDLTSAWIATEAIVNSNRG